MSALIYKNNGQVRHLLPQLLTKTSAMFTWQFRSISIAAMYTCSFISFSIDLELLIRTIFEVYDFNRHKACNLAVVKRFNLLNPTDQQVVRSSQTHAVQPNMVQTHKSYFNFVEITTFYIKTLACRAKKHNLFMLWGSRQC